MTKKQARTLAVSYNAFQEARKEDDENGTHVWTGILCRAQRETGVELIPFNELAYWATYKKRVA